MMIITTITIEVVVVVRAVVKEGEKRGKRKEERESACVNSQSDRERRKEIVQNCNQVPQSCCSS